jgi:hypothetical protein
LIHSRVGSPTDVAGAVVVDVARQPFHGRGAPGLGSPQATGRPNSSARYSMRVCACWNSALKSRCSSRLSRRMSTMNAMPAGFSAM